jgi:hypothetical protein
MASSSIKGHNLWTIAKFVISINDLDKNVKDLALKKKSQVGMELMTKVQDKTQLLFTNIVMY